MAEPGALSATWWGHAFTTVELAGVAVATDPLLGAWLGPLRRYASEPPAEATAAEVVVVSHLHADHLHVGSLARFPRGTAVVLPAGGEALLRGVRSLDVLAVRPGDEVEVRGVRIEVLGASHDERRSPLSRHRAPAVGFRISRGDASFWYPGDTGLRDDMGEVDPVDLALVPIGGWGPTLGDEHMDPEEAAEAVGRVGARWALPVHWGTWWPVGLRHVLKDTHDRLFREPGQRFARAAGVRAPGAAVVLPAHGERRPLRP